MNIRLWLFVAGQVNLLTGLVMLLPLGIALKDGASEAAAFAGSVLVLLVSGLFLLLAGRNHSRKVGMRDGVLLLGFIWLLLGIAGMLPYLLDGRLGWLDAGLESVAGFTTTGLSCLPDSSPRAFLLWRSLTQWLGGLVILVLLVTVLPEAGGCFGLTLSLHRSKLFSQMIARMEKTAIGVSGIYIVLSGLLLLVYWGCGLGLFDAVNLSLVTISTGGCYDSPAVHGFASLPLTVAVMGGMLVSSGNFLLYREAVRRRRLREILHDVEMRVFLLLVVLFGLIMTWHLWRSGIDDLFSCLRYGFFAVLSFASTTGFSAGDFLAWPDFDRYILFLLAFVGGCMGSSTGGIKVIRFLIMLKSAGAEMKRTLHPHMIVHIMLDKVTVPGSVVGRVMSFFFLFLAAFFLFAVGISLSGMPVLAAMSLSTACLSSTGPAAMLAGGAGTFLQLPDWTKVVCCVLMILGRLEIFSFLVILQMVQSAWRRKW